jgi:hypothetical protein
MNSGPRLSDESLGVQVIILTEKVVRLEEKLGASAVALGLSREELLRYQETNNHWRQAMNDQRAEFVTTGQLIGVIGACVGLASVCISAVALTVHFAK